MILCRINFFFSPDQRQGAGGGLDLGGFRHLQHARRSQFREPPCRYQNTALQRTYRFVVGIYSPVQVLPYGTEMSRKDAQPLIQLFAEFTDLLRILSDLLLVPSVGNRLEERNEGCRGGRDYALIHAILN